MVLLCIPGQGKGLRWLSLKLIMKPETKPSRVRQLAWLLGLWLASVTALALFALGLRGIMNLVGMTA